MSDLQNSPPEPSDAALKPDADASSQAWSEMETELERPISDRPSFAPPSLRRADPSGALVTVETAFLASTGSLIWLINYYFPFPVFQIFFSVPIALLYLRWGHRAAWMGNLISGLLLTVLMGPARSLLFVMPFGFLGVLLGLLWHRRASWGVSVAIASLLRAIGFFFRIWLVSLLLGDDLWLYTTNQATELVEWVFLKLGLLVQPSLWMVQLAIVGLVLLNSVIYVFVVHLAAWFLLDRLGNPIPRPPKWVQVMMEYE
ncbi:MAG TPA: DUF2232 domain-containing protein [Thermosynechococcaceae cyanobacterium]